LFLKHGSDKAIIKEIRILSHLLPGDVVLADKGFNILEKPYKTWRTAC